jgi:hypothetical protein
LDQFADAVQKYDELEENATSADDYFAVLENLAPIHRTTRHLHQVLQEARQFCPDDRHIINFRDRAYEIERAAELLYNETKNAMDFAVAKQAEAQTKASHQMAVSAHRLNLLAAFFFPLATLSAIFGVNLLHGFEDVPPPIPILCLVGVGLISGIALMKFINRQSS